MMMRKNMQKMRSYNRRRYMQRTRFIDDNQLHDGCKEQVLERHVDTGLPLVIRAEYKIGNIIFIYNNKNGDGMMDYMTINGKRVF